MPAFTIRVQVAAPVEDVWKLLHDPMRFPDWWEGVETVRPDGDEGFTMWPTGYPDFPMPQRLHTDRADGRVTISCLVSDLEFVWRLRPVAAASGDETELVVDVRIPQREAHRLAGQRTLIERSVVRLAELVSPAGGIARTPGTAGSPA